MPERVFATTVLLALGAAHAAAPASTVQVAVRQVEENKYEFELTNPVPIDERTAQGIVAAVARSTCRELAPVPGKYQFESMEPLAGDGKSAPGKFRFVQEVTCGAATSAPAPGPRPAPLSAEQTRRLQQEIDEKSQQYFSHLAAGRLDEAYALLSPERLGTTEASWKQDKQSFREAAGAPMRIVIARITVYDNPAGAPEPGLYVAADYANEWRNAPVHCGYLMWFRGAGGEFRITREENGLVTSKQLESIPADQHEEIRRRMRCVAPEERR